MPPFVGDPQEACAISTAFFGDRQRETDEDPLFVGSIKTVIGHTEGTAGVAGLMKASQAIQRGMIPPNMLFEELSPRVAPFYSNLQVVTKEQTWPALKYDQPRRVSVNSFGFGGTNVHVILESYAANLERTMEQPSTACLSPIVLSANSNAALKAAMEDLKRTLDNQPDLALPDLAWTLLKKRSNLQVRHTIPAKTIQGLCEHLEKEGPLIGQSKSTLAMSSDARAKPQILGIFTGQGAQWPAMGKRLVTEVPYARKIITELDDSLQDLPAKYRPEWKLVDQLLLEGSDSKVHDASYSQPLCAAVQIMLIKLLEAAGVGFKAVIGHSSGEIACAFAAGFIPASSAIRIAFLRGLTSKYASGPKGIEGAMLAAGTSFEDATELCALETFEGRVSVAASNGPDSVTLSGDKDAILEVEQILIDEKRFARVLKVDKAYHSHHMKPCAEPYVAALRACGCDQLDIDTNTKPKATWLSSVHDGRLMQAAHVKPEYWAENLLSPVLFSFAVEMAIVKHMPLDVCIEVGAHPALKNPTLQTINNCTGSDVGLPYTGCMERQKDDCEAFSACLGYLWAHFGSPAVDIDGLYHSLAVPRSCDLSKQLPSYSWDHSRSYRKESRTVKRLLYAERPHLLLGRQSAHSTPSAVHWQNFIRPRDIPWLEGHSLQGQIVFPGAGYIVMAMEAATQLAGERSVQLVEVLDLQIDKAVTFDDENSMVEMTLSLDLDSKKSTTSCVMYAFAINSCLARETGLTRSVAGEIAVTYGPEIREALPAPTGEPAHLNDDGVDRFYDMLERVGYNYTGLFRGITDLKRGDCKSYGTMKYDILEDGEYTMVLHPSVLDVAFQSMIAAYTGAGSGRMHSLLVPTGIARIALNPWVAAKATPPQLSFTSTSITTGSTSMSGDIEVFDPDTNATMLHVEGIGFKPTIPPTAEDDHLMYTQWRMGPLHPDALFDEENKHATDQDKKEVEDIERVTYWFIKHIMADVTTEDRAKASFTFTKYIQWCEHVLSDIQAGRNPWYTSEWDHDTQDAIGGMIQNNLSSPLMRLIQRVGEAAVETLRNDQNAFDLLDHDGLLTELYGGETSYGQSYYYYKQMLGQVSHRFPNMDILEIGAGTAGASRLILNNDRIPFKSYTFTDISSHFFEAASTEFQHHADKMHFRPLDIRRTPAEQGFEPHSYDLITASNVLHATPNLRETLANVRSLLKPGGRLVVIEICHETQTRLGFIFGLFPDWWSGHDEGRVLGPFINYDEWDKVLKSTGFAGVETRSLDPDSITYPSGVFLSRAVDDVTKALDSPLDAPIDNPGSLVIVGGSSQKSRRLVSEIGDVLPSRKWENISSLQDVVDFDLHPGTTFIVLSELDEHTFEGLDDVKFDALQTIFNAARHVLWVTENAWVDNAQQAMTLGLLRSLRLEYPDVQIQTLDVEQIETLSPRFLVETALRLEVGVDWEEKGLLWAMEPEIYLSGGKVSVPRLKRDAARNNRLNSGRRAILADSDPRKEILSLGYEDGNPVFRTNMQGFDDILAQETLINIEVQFSLAKTLRIGRTGFQYLVQGKIAGSNTTVVALSDSNASRVQIPCRQAITVAKNRWSTRPLLLGISANIVATTLVSDLPKGSIVLVFEPRSIYVEALRDRASAAGVSLTFASTKSPPHLTGVRWIRVHERETERSLLQKLPKDVSVLIDFVADRHPASLSQRLVKYMPSGCTVHGPDYLFQDVATSTSNPKSEISTEFLKSALSPVRDGSDIDTASILTATELLATKIPHGINPIVDWTTEKHISSRIQPIETTRMFSNDKTYLLAGLAGDMGRSLARFMVDHGARHIVLSSRVPKIDQRWIDDLTRCGGNIMVLPMDVSDEVAVDEGLAKIKASMPPIGGVAFGPLLLADVMFKNMELPALEMVLAPKVTGARLLNERLSDPSNPLDFFVMFSSIVLVVGNPGQAAYSAANAYLNAVARSRRARGLAGSTIDIGAVIGVGFIHRAGRENEAQTRMFLADEVNERELHALFAEAVVAGRDGSPDDIELVTGMAHLDEKLRDRIPWFSDPRFAEFQRSERLAAGGEGGKNVVSIKEQLSKVETLEEAHHIILEGVSARIRGALLFGPGDELNLTAPLIDQGVDSLSAVTVVSWFSKNLNLDIPLLKILGGASATDLVDDATSRLNSELVPLVDPSSFSASVQIAHNAPPAVSPSSSGTSNGGMGSSVEDSSTQTPISSPSSEGGDSIERTGPFSLVQEYTWKEMQLPLDPSTFNTTIGMYMQGPLDFGRLSWAFSQALQRHDAFKTCYTSENGQPMQTVMKASRNAFHAVKVTDKSAADAAFNELQSAKYDLEKGDTLKIIDYFWTNTDHLLVIAYHRLVGDGWTTEHFFVEVSMLYSGLPLEPAPSYIDYSNRQRTELAAGAFEIDLTYWSELFKTLPLRLPVLSVATASASTSSSSISDWSSHEAEARLSRMVAVRIRDRARKQQATAMHVYLACFNILLARLTEHSDITIGVADAGRASLTDQATMGYFASYLPVRLPYDSGHVFNDALKCAKEQMRAALQHSSVPLPAILERLGLPTVPTAEDESTQTPLFQAIFDYKQGQTESGSIGEAKMVDSIIPRAGTPYDITLQMGDDPSKGEPIITVKLRKEKYGPDAAEAVLHSYLSIVNTFARNPVLRVTDAPLEGTKM